MLKMSSWWLNLVPGLQGAISLRAEAPCPIWEQMGDGADPVDEALRQVH